jgi:hypothetical protein
MAIENNPVSLRSQSGKEDTVIVAVRCEEKIGRPRIGSPGRRSLRRNNFAG